MSNVMITREYGCKDNNGEELKYSVYVPDDTDHRFKTVVVYMHGLSSGQSWYRIPEIVPSNTAILYLPRQPKTDCIDFKTWYKNYRICLNDFSKKNQYQTLHLIANCYGAMIALMWASKEPETFFSLTLINPPISSKKGFTFTAKLKILLDFLVSKILSGKGFQVRHFMSSDDYSRLPSVINTIKESIDSSFLFRGRFFIQALRLQNWLRNNFIELPIPCHMILSSEDRVFDYCQLHKSYWKKLLPEQISRFKADHYLELTPQRNLLWQTVFDFYKKYNPPSTYIGRVGKILVTGSTGFVGSNLVKQLCSDGLQIIVFARDLKKAKVYFSNYISGIEFRQGNLANVESVSSALKGVSIIIHAAGFVDDWAKYEQFSEVNIEGTKNLIMAAHEQGIDQVIHISSLGIFGDIDQYNVTENTQLRYSSDYYSNTKLVAEIFVKKYCRENNIAYTIVRPGFIYGEGDNNFFPKLIEKLKAGQVSYLGSGSNCLNTVYVGNVIELIKKIIANPNCFGESYNIVDSGETTIKRFIEDVADGLNINRPYRRFPIIFAFIVANVLESVYRILNISSPPVVTRKKITFMARSRLVNANKAYALIGKVPYFYDDAIKKTLSYFSSEL